MRRAVESLSVHPTRSWFDGPRCPLLAVPVRSDSRWRREGEGDRGAAPSWRRPRGDAEMCRLHGRFPQYGFDEHKDIRLRNTFAPCAGTAYAKSTPQLRPVPRNPGARRLRRGREFASSLRSPSAKLCSRAKQRLAGLRKTLQASVMAGSRVARTYLARERALVGEPVVAGSAPSMPTFPETRDAYHRHARGGGFTNDVGAAFIAS